MSRLPTAEEDRRWTPYGNDNGRPQEDLPPSNLDAERGVLACMMLDTTGAVIDDPAIVALKPGDFTDTAHRIVYRHLVGLHLEGKPAGDHTLLSSRIAQSGELPDARERAALLKRIIGGEATCNAAKHYADLVRETAQRRKLWELSRELSEQVASGLPPRDIEGFIAEFVEATARSETVGVPCMARARETFCWLRQPVIRGLIRCGETLNIIAPPKVGKSWLVTDLALSVITGAPWLDTFTTEPGAVLVVDNELHAETSVYRVDTVAAARGIKIGEYGEQLFVENVRGRLKDIHAMESFFRGFAPGRFRLVILDALYRFLPPGVSENENSTMAQVYNAIDAYAARMDCSFVCIHHGSKGNQSHKGVTDVGAGAGAQSRAADCHLIMRAHETDGVYVVEAAVRSFQPVAPFCLRWTFPVWNPAPECDPALLRPDKPRRKAEKPPEEPTEAPWTAERFAADFVKAEPALKLAIIDTACAAGLTQTTAEKLLKRAAAKKLAHPWRCPDDGRQVMYASVPELQETA